MLRRSSASYPDGEIDQSTVAMASLVQLNEISRRAEDAGMSFGNVLSQSNAGVGNAMLRPSSRIWSAAANAGLINPDGSFVDPPSNPAPPAPVSATSRIDALQQIAQLQRNRPSSRAMMKATATKIAKGLGDLQSLRGSMESGPSGPVPEGSDSPSTGSEEEEMVMPSEPNPAASGPPEDISSPTQPDPPPTELWNPAEDDFILNPPQATLNHPGLQVYTVGHLLPRSSVDDENGNWSFDPNLLQAGGALPFEGAQVSFSEAGPSSIPRSESAQTLRVRRSTYVPGWAVPPRVLLVDDDAVSRKLGSKFLQVFGCTFDVAVDGVSAVNKMNLEKYDLVLMVRALGSLFPS